ncbi:MAG: ATP-binding protein, partial [Egibacteraceae bacterium]
MSALWQRRLRLARHRATTAHLSSAYPFQAEAGLGARGVYLGTNVLSGGSGFAYDPFEAYAAGIVSNPNILLAGEPGVGKSAAAKTFIYRSVGVFGRWVAIAD